VSQIFTVDNVRTAASLLSIVNDLYVIRRPLVDSLFIFWTGHSSLNASLQVALYVTVLDKFTPSNVCHCIVNTLASATLCTGNPRVSSNCPRQVLSLSMYVIV